MNNAKKTDTSVATALRALIGNAAPVDEESFRKAHEVCSTAPVYAPDDPRGFSFAPDEERGESRTVAPTRVRPRLGPRKPAGRVWGVLLLCGLPWLGACSQQPTAPTSSRDLIAIGMMFGFVLLMSLIEAWRDKK